MNILDIGCGIGQNFNLLSKRGIYYGIDILEKNIENNKIVFPKSTFEVADITNKTNFKDGFFDEIYCFDVLEHVNNIDNALSEIYRIINKFTGKLIIEVPSIFTETVFIKLNPNYNKQVGHKRCLSENEWIETIQKHGFFLHQKQLKKFKDLLYLSHKFFRGKNIINDMGEFDEGVVTNEDLLNTKIWLTNNQYIENLFSDLYGKSLRLEFKTKPCKLINPKKIPDELDKIKNEKEKLHLGLDKIKNEKEKLQLGLDKIQSSKTYKLWQKYNLILKKLKIKNTK